VLCSRSAEPTLLRDASSEPSLFRNARTRTYERGTQSPVVYLTSNPAINAIAGGRRTNAPPWPIFFFFPLFGLMFFGPYSGRGTRSSCETASSSERGRWPAERLSSSSGSRTPGGQVGLCPLEQTCTSKRASQSDRSEKFARCARTTGFSRTFRRGQRSQ